MATIIEQKPLYSTLTVGENVIFAVSNTNIVSAFTDVKFIATVHISDQIPNPSILTDVVGTFKTTPNNAGVGMFDFRPIVESFVSSDNLARKDSLYKGVLNGLDNNVPMHLIDKFSGNINTMRYLVVKFTVQYNDGTGSIIENTTGDISLPMKLINGYLKYTDELDLIGVNFGYNMHNQFSFTNLAERKFLTNAPLIQYANINDYGTVGLLMSNPFFPGLGSAGANAIRYKYYDDSNVEIANEDVPQAGNGGFKYPQSIIDAQMLYAGVFPANLSNWSTLFNANIANIAYYTFQVIGSPPLAMSSLYRININCPNTKGFESIRLCWLNQWGAWDYYTFIMKSIKKISTKGSTYQQLEGSWNSSSYRIDSFRGGKKAFRVNATEKITMNTDFVNESESAWFEELINSPEVYLLKEKSSDATNSALNQYVTPVRLTTSSYTKKTVANDKLMQYTFEVEKSKTLRTQSI
tara:strand:+ start:48 stop:1445 length:1398 start_codon:yes stop_codon:yes gene_type:complete